MIITIDLSSESAGIREATWKKLTTAEKKAYVKKHPNSKYAKTGNQAKKGSKKAKSTKTQRKVGKGFKAMFVWSQSDTKNEVKSLIKEVSKAAGVSGLKVHGNIERDPNSGFECEVIAPTREALEKFTATYAGYSDYKSYKKDFDDEIEKV